MQMKMNDFPPETLGCQMSPPKVNQSKPSSRPAATKKRESLTICVEKPVQLTQSANKRKAWKGLNFHNESGGEL